MADSYILFIIKKEGRTKLTGDQPRCSAMALRYTKNTSKQNTTNIKRYNKPQKAAAITGRIIIENLQLYWEVMSYVNANKIQSARIELDQEKAFDRVDQNFLMKALHVPDMGTK